MSDMTDIDLIRELRPAAPLPGAGDLIPARARLSSAIATECADGRRPESPPAGAERSGRARVGGRRARGPWPTRRLALAAVAAAAAVAAGVTVLLVVPGHARSAPSASATQHAPGTVDLTVARFLQNAASAARRLPALAPHPDQFVFTETESANGAKSQSWLSVDGSRDGLVQNAGQRSSVLTPCTIAEAERSHCYPEAGYLPDMPTDPHQLLTYLDGVGIANAIGRDDSEPGWEANDLGKAVAYLMQTTYLLPAQQAALFELMAQTPGFRLAQGARDAVGRIGVGVEWKFEGAPAEIILSPTTYAFMGLRTFPAPGFSAPDADAYDGDALVKVAIVNRAGQLP